MAVFLITGASGSGKTAIAHTLKKRSVWIECLSHTTRVMREGEQHGETYYFISEEEFENMLNKGEFAEHVVYDNNKYGISKVVLEEALDSGKHVYIIVEYDGYKQIKALYPDAVGIFLYSSIEDCMINMLKRGDKLQSAKQRIKTYGKELANKGEFDYVVKNVRDKLLETANIIHNIVNQYND